MIRDRLVIAVISPTFLLPKNFDRKTVDVDRRLANAAVGVRGSCPALDRSPSD